MTGKRFGRVLMMMMLALCGVSWAQTARMDASLGMMRFKQQNAEALARQSASHSVDVIASGVFHRRDMEAQGGKIRWQRGELAIVTMAVDKLDALLNVPGLRYLEASQIATPVADISMKEIGALQARDQTGLSGKNVLIGIVDSGIDYTHPDFRTADGATRIKYILDFSTPGSYYGGTVYNEAQINTALSGNPMVLQKDNSGHGSHVAGIAAGNGGGGAEYGAFAGVAPQANLIAVKATRNALKSEFSSTDQLLAISFIDSVATLLGMPCVVNLSFGTNFGAHDGTTAVERYIDDLSGPGRVVVVAAGNEGGKKTHAQASLTSSSAQISVSVPEYTPNAGSGNDHFVLDGWYDGTHSLSVTVISPRGETFGPVNDGKYLGRNSSDGQVLIWNGYYEEGSDIQPGVSPFNQDKEIIIEVCDDLGVLPYAGEWTVKLSGRAGEVHFWLASVSMEAVFKTGVSDRMSLTIPGTSKSAITVGAYTTRETWKDLDGNNLTIDTQGTIIIGEVAEFSGAGPSRDDRIKPEITAPGRIIGSSLSQEARPGGYYSIFNSPDVSYPNAFVLPDGVHALSLGTSMAAPHVSGTVALLLEKYPEAPASRIKQALIYTARAQGGAKKDQWGYGKINCAAAALLRLEELPEDPDDQPPIAFRVSRPYPNPFRYSTNIDYEIPVTSTSAQRLTITVYNTMGQKLRTLYQGEATAGRYPILWNGRDARHDTVASGLYFIEFVYGSKHTVEKVCLLSGN